jgi:hypothetical protein
MLLKLATLGALGFMGYKFYERSRDESRAAFADGQPAGEGTVRDAGPEAMADPPKREWTKADENSDESFPASDPPGSY